MASVQSHGLHEPTALQYLISEGILQAGPSPDSYVLRSYLSPADTGSGLVDEEVVIAQSCVVWSRAGLVKRVLNFNTEDETILNAFTTFFETEAESSTSSETASPGKRHEKALVVVLRSQAHILLLSGDSHVLPLPFEVETSFACPYGFILQRKLSNDDQVPNESSFHHDLSTINESQGTVKTNSGRPSLLLPDAPNLGATSTETTRGMPRAYSCTEIMSELGLVVCGSSNKPIALDDCPPLPFDEDLLYVSPYDELHTLGIKHASLCLAVSKHRSTGKISIWHIAQEVPLTSQTQPRAKKTTRKSEGSRKKSSNIHARKNGVATPAPRGPSRLRESFGGLAPLNADNLLHSSTTDQKSSNSEDLAAQFGPGFGDVGVQTRSARRVSSMLARTDLGAGNDRGAFHDLAMGQGTRKSLNRPGNRGESLGSFGDRQSFGRRRSSFPATTSILSTGTSFLNVPGRSRASLLEPGHGPDVPNGLNAPEGNSHVPHEIGFFKLTSFSMSDEGRNSVDSTTDSYKVLTFASPSKAGDLSTDLSVCVHDQLEGRIAIINVHVDVSPAPSDGKESNISGVRLKATKIRRGSGITGACLVLDIPIVRLLILTRNRDGQPSLQLEAPWSPPLRIDLPQTYLLSQQLRPSPAISPEKRREKGIHRVGSHSEIDVSGVESFRSDGRLLMVDSTHQRHLLYMGLQPRDHTVQAIIKLSNLIFGPEYQDCLLVAMWEVLRWLRNRDQDRSTEWTAMMVTLFSLAVPFVEEKQSETSTPQKRKKSGFIRSASGAAIDLNDFHAMKDSRIRTFSSSPQGSAWNWLEQPLSLDNIPRSPRHSKISSMQTALDAAEASNTGFLLQCVSWAREYVQSPAGEASIGTEGYLPIAVNKDRSTRQTALAKLLVGLHLLNEECRLDMTAGASNSSATALQALLPQFGQWLSWEDWTMTPGSYYFNDSTKSDPWAVEESRVTGLETPGQPFAPPSIFEHIVECISGRPDHSFPTLEVLLENLAEHRTTTNINSSVMELTPRTLSILAFCRTLNEGAGHAGVVKYMQGNKTDQTLILAMPDGAATALHQTASFIKARDQRNHLNLSSVGNLDTEAIAKLRISPSHDANRDYHSVSVSTVETESLQRWDASSEADRHTITRLIFQDDRRFQEASKLVNQTRPPVVECTPEPQWSEADLLEAQQQLAQFVTRRTLSVASGRGMMHFNARVPLLTERVPIPAFSLQCVMRSRHISELAQSMTLSADKATFTEDKVCWAFFHNGASAGLMITKDAKGIDTSWILYNKPPELTNRHAGFLLALGLNGHLKNLAKWVAFKYLTPKHTMTSIGLLLGLSASYLGTQDQLITRMLSVHVTRLLPPGSTELNVSPLTQTTGIMGIGLLYYNSQHRRMSEVMLSELENNDSEEGAPDDSVLRDEGYRLAAGFSLGLINLGQGKKLHGLHDMAVVERLLAIAVSTKNVNLVHILDRATSGAVMAVALLFLKSNDKAIASKIDIPDTIHQFDYVRPDIFLLRTLARHLVMWGSILPIQDFIESSLPRSYRSRAALSKTCALHTEDMPFYNILTGILLALGLRFAGSQSPVVRDLLVSYLDQFLRLSRLPCPHYDARVTLNSVRNCLDVLALATASIMAGSGDLVVLRRLRSLHGRTDKDTPFGSHMAAHMAIGTLFLGGGTMTFGTSDLAVAGLCIAFYPLFPGDVLDNKTHLQALRHLWVLAVEGRCLVARSEGEVVGGVEGTVILRNGQQVCVRAPGLVPDFAAIESIEVKGEGYWDVNLDFTDHKILGKVKQEGGVNVAMTRRPGYDKPPRSDALLEGLEALEEERRLAGCDVPSVDPNVASRTHGNVGSGTDGQGDPFEWLFDLESFKGYDYKERDLALNSLSYVHDQKSMLEGTVVDQRLEFERGCLPESLNAPRDAVGLAEAGWSSEGAAEMQRDRLWQVRLLLEWDERFRREDEEAEARAGGAAGVVREGDAAEGQEQGKWSDGMWLRREVVERLRERVCKMAGNDERGGDEL